MYVRQISHRSVHLPHYIIHLLKHTFHTYEGDSWLLCCICYEVLIIFYTQRQNKSQSTEERGDCKRTWDSVITLQLNSLSFTCVCDLSMCLGSQLVGVGSNSPVETACTHHNQCLACPTKTNVNACIKAYTHLDGPMWRGAATFTPWGGLVVFTSLSKLLDCEVVIVIKFLKDVGGKQ